MRTDERSDVKIESDAEKLTILLFIFLHNRGSIPALAVIHMPRRCCPKFGNPPSDRQATCGRLSLCVIV